MAAQSAVERKNIQMNSPHDEETIPETTAQEVEETALAVIPAKLQPKVSPFDGLIQIGQSFPLNGVWCRVAKFDGPHIILVATEYTTKLNREIKNAAKLIKKKARSAG